MREEVRRFKLRERAKAVNVGAISGLDGLTSDMIAQLKAMLAAQQRPANSVGPAQAERKLPKTILPLDQDERGYGNF